MSKEATEKLVNNRTQSNIVDADTGELLGTANPGDCIKVIRRSSIESFVKLQNDTVDLNKGRDFVKQFPDISEKLCAALNGNEMWLLMFLMPYVGINSGILKTKSGSFVSRAFLLERVTLSRAALDRALDGLVKHGILAKCYIKNDKCYIMNPHVCHRGSKANETLLSLFINTEWRG